MRPECNSYLLCQEHARSPSERDEHVNPTIPIVSLFSWLVYVLGSAAVCGASGEASSRPSADHVIGTLERGPDDCLPRALQEAASGDWSRNEAERIAEAVTRCLAGGTSREQAAETLVLLGQKYPGTTVSAIPVLGGLLGSPGMSFSPDERLLCEVSRALGVIGTKARPATERLRSLRERRGEYYYASVWAACALARIEPENSQALEWFRVRLRQRVDALCLFALGEIGEGAKPLVAELRRCLDHRDGAVRVGAATALWRISKETDQKMLDVLAHALFEKGEPIAFKPPVGLSPQWIKHSDLAVTLLAAMGRDARPALPSLEKAEKVGDDFMRPWAASAIARIRASGPPSRPKR